MNLSPLCLLCGSKLCGSKLLANSSCAHLFFFILLGLRDKKLFQYFHLLISCSVAKQFTFKSATIIFFLIFNCETCLEVKFTS